MECLNCKTEIDLSSGSGRPRKYCSRKCNDVFNSAQKKLTRSKTKVQVCIFCSKDFLKNVNNHKTLCSDACRKSQTELKLHSHQITCKGCNLIFSGIRTRTWCDDCIKANKPWEHFKVDYANAKKCDQRLARESAAGGMTRNQRQRLLKLWKSQTKKCFYCDKLADTIDHVVPLFRGGTNHEGNLVPCCRSCNSGKQASFITEWKLRNARATTKAKRVKA